ncbi:MAG: ATP-dependent zinc metalloprotease FtsH [Polyangiaceae bacterium]|nr:ATP-dependent zinc metalloprotease FtsH [Polyangiaceae bacterium]
MALDDPAPTPTPPQPPGRRRLRWFEWLLPLVLIGGLVVQQLMGRLGGPEGTQSYSEVVAAVERGEVERVVLREKDLVAELGNAQTVDGRSVTRLRAELPALEDRELLPLLKQKGVEVVAQREEEPWLVRLLLSLLPFAVLIGVWLWISRRTQNALFGGGGPLGSALKQKARRFGEGEAPKVRFEDVAGLANAKRDLEEVVHFLREPERFGRLGGKLPRGVLLIGAPGTGKTLMARAVAGESGVPFFSIAASEFIELFVGVGAARVRDLFAEAKKAAPAIVFIDEIDAVGRSRGTGLGGGHDEREQTLNQLLAEMDGFQRTDRIVVMAATNRPDVLDAALLRPGRFDRRVVLGLPERPARQAILEVHTRDKPLADDVALDELASLTPGFSGADLANLVNEAALGATRRGGDSIARADFLAAQDKIMLGDPRETRLTEADKRRVAVHEAGHAVVAHTTPGARPLKRVTIIPRGLALGATQQEPDGDAHLVLQSELVARLRVLMGGLAAERALLGESSTGAENDLKQATELALKMVGELGMSERIGPVYHENAREHPFLGQRIATDSGASDATRHLVEDEAAGLLRAALEAASGAISRHRPSLERLVERLLVQETLEAEALREVLGEPLRAGPGGEPISERSGARRLGVAVGAVDGPSSGGALGRS